MLANLLIGNVTKILDKAILDKDLKAQLEADLMTAINSVDEAQIKINLQDAKSNNWFQSMWRPAIAWICVCGFYKFFSFTFMFSIWNNCTTGRHIRYVTCSHGYVRTWRIKNI